MEQFLNSPVGVYVTMAVLYIIAGIALRLIHVSIRRVEDWVNKNESAQDAAKMNGFLDVIDRLAETAVQDANSRMVIDLKTHGLFTKATADSVKQAVIADVLNNLGPLKDSAQAALGPLESIIGQSIEKYVLNYKHQVNQYVQLSQSKQAQMSSGQNQAASGSPQSA